MDLLDFLLKLAEELLYMGKTVKSKKKGRPSKSLTPASQTNVFLPAQKVDLLTNARLHQLQQDMVGHIPKYDTRKEATWCK